MKRKLLFVLPSFHIGGTTVSVRNLISVLDKEKYDITVWAMDSTGILKWMYEGIELLPTCFTVQALALSSWRNERNWCRRVGAAVIRWMVKVSTTPNQIISRHAIRRCVGNQQYDTVVACQEGKTSAFVANFDCDNLVAWVRCDYKHYFRDHNNCKELFYERFNHIVCVAEKTKDNFSEIYPQLADRTICIYNPQDSSLIQSQAEIDDHDCRFKTDKTIIVSIGRLGKVKRFTEIPSIARQLIDRGFDFKWFIIGDGGEQAAIAEKIKSFDVVDHVVMLGAKSNPHFYIKKADLYVCLSSSEACPRVVNEAKILRTPVVSTDFPTIYEYLEDGVNGRIVPLRGMANAIAELLNDKEMFNRIKKEIEGFEFDNSELIKQLEEVL